ncbi:formamidopyrimidine-DNA glycosylase [Marivirga sericea]|uniref:Formamidopyrimidine-DNA glycosylase n=1 Tax=Marivirga sericea TaxID=1028 RepID=A0A1X7JRP6_9BACT|nr:DNA-formamidopyrimidine glycosylase family protein [Marivirga sericea]SMG30784.1 formamidopyrimidine-DNA glycosylase [Marivirga sericea]
MPELPEVENFKKYFDGTSLNQKIVAFDCADDRLLKQARDLFSNQLIGKHFESSKRIGKYFFVETNGDPTLVMHFGMTGRLTYYKDQEDRPKFAHIVFEFENGFHLGFENKRKFGWMDLTTSIDSYQKEKKLSDDARDLSWKAFYNALKNRKTFIKPVLLDQKVAAGIGNWMADEILYQAKIHPESKIEAMKEKQLKSIFDAMKKVIETAIEKEAVYADFPQDFLMHNRREDGNCYHTGDDIIKTKVGGRATYISPSWQKKID